MESGLIANGFLQALKQMGARSHVHV